jgi:hypothetical protein
MQANKKTSKKTRKQKPHFETTPFGGRKKKRQQVSHPPPFQPAMCDK